MVVPTYNEKDGLAELTRALFAAAGAYGLALELVIVDDNSPDGTGAIADALTETYRVRVVHLRQWSPGSGWRRPTSSA